MKNKKNRKQHLVLEIELPDYEKSLIKSISNKDRKLKLEKISYDGDKILSYDFKIMPAKKCKYK